MNAEHVNVAIEFVARILEIVGVGVIVLAFVRAIILDLVRYGRNREEAYERVKTYLGKSLLLGLEFLVAADIIRTVIITPTQKNLLSLGLLILLRIVLGWSITVEIEGCWPWQLQPKRKRQERGE